MKTYFYHENIGVPKESPIQRVIIVQVAPNAITYHKCYDSDGYYTSTYKSFMAISDQVYERLDESFALCLLYGWGHKP